MKVPINFVSLSIQRELSVNSLSFSLLFFIFHYSHFILGRYGTEQNAMMLRLGITPIQRLHREAISEHGDALMKGLSLSQYHHFFFFDHFLILKGARGTMRPYATTLEEAEVYFQSLNYPVTGSG